MRYAEAMCRRGREADSYRVYVTDELKLRAQGKSHADRWADIVRPQPEIDVDDVVEHMVAKHGLEVVNGPS